MQAMSDIELLRHFVGKGDERAFREIVGRYADLVYSAAVRQVESSASAADIAQSVFADLARKAGGLVKPGGLLAEAGSLAGWLHRATRYAALNYLRDAGCDYAQGPHIARPMSVPDIARWLSGADDAALRMAS